jgi:ACT domain-containing protein
MADRFLPAPEAGAAGCMIAVIIHPSSGGRLAESTRLLLYWRHRDSRHRRLTCCRLILWMVEAKRMNLETSPSAKELLFITVIGQDKKGIVARISGLLYESNINIEDISQGIMEGYFVMTMAVDMREAHCDLETLGAALQALGDDMGMRIQIQHQNVFKMMHRI